ncbi:gliding motility-associated peptidyl-prolyl isomerase GldI, partial [uncultured Lutibacter sp.]|uniref:gliding motility-associated peptidyl-prolyl isomerase GldI n=1 Tax=uncultured Lutibacter sp. TaxID=437739 RepID=UPI0026265976
MKHSFLLLIISFLLFSCGNTIARKPIVRKTATFMKESVSFNKSLISEEENEIKSIMELDSLNTYIASSDGFWYKYEQKNIATYVPQFGDELTYTFNVSDFKNNIIYTSEEIGEQLYVVDQQEIIEGLRNGLKLMNEGDIVTFLFPSHKVFGYLGDQKKID